MDPTRQPADQNQNPMPTFRRSVRVYDRPFARASATPPLIQEIRPPITQQSVVQTPIAAPAPMQQQAPAPQPVTIQETVAAPPPLPEHADLQGLKPVWQMDMPDELQNEPLAINQQAAQAANRLFFTSKPAQPSEPLAPQDQTVPRAQTEPVAHDPITQPPLTPVPVPQPETVRQEPVVPPASAEIQQPVQFQQSPRVQPVQPAVNVAQPAMIQQQPAAWQVPDLSKPASFEQQFSEHAKHAKKKFNFRQSAIKFAPKAMVVMAVIVFLGGGVTAFMSWRTNNQAKQKLAVFNVEQDNSGILGVQPSETPNQTLGAQQVSGDVPALLKIPNIGVEATVTPVSASQNNIIKAPSSIFDVGWFESSAKPSQSGTVVLNGHVAGPSRDGALHDLGTLSNGDEIILTTGDKTTYRYAVRDVDVFEDDQIDTTKLLNPYLPGQKGLNIMTAGGRYNTEKKAYELRFAVYAVMME